MDCKVQSLLDSFIYEDIKTISDYPLDWAKLENKTVFITGAGGFIGYYLTCALLIRNDVYGSNIKVIALGHENIKKRFGELLKRSDITAVVQDVCDDISCPAADFVIHGASPASAYFFENNPVGTMDANITGACKVLEYARKSNAQSSLIISSFKIYGTLHSGKNEITEDEAGYLDCNSYKNCYAQGKRASETIACCFAKQFNMNVKIARPCYIYGPARIDDDRVWAQFIANVVRNQDILLKSNGATLRSFCYVTDTVTALLKILLDGENCTPYNIANSASDVTIRNFAKTASEAFPERNLKLIFENKEDEKEPEYSPLSATPEILNADRLRTLGWKPLVDLADGIKRSVKIVELQNKGKL